MNQVVIRKYVSEDRPQVRRISCETAFLGLRKDFFYNDEVLADALTRYYTDFEPQSCFVAVVDGQVVGYLIGSLDVKKARSIFLRRILGPLFIKGILENAFFHRQTLLFLWNVFKDVLSGAFFVPNFYAYYPATLHINLDHNFRGQGIGSLLMDNFLIYLKEENVCGVHFGTFSEASKEFFLKQGFLILYSGRRNYFKYRLGYTIPYVVLGKKFEG